MTGGPRHRPYVEWVRGCPGQGVAAAYAVALEEQLAGTTLVQSRPRWERGSRGGRRGRGGRRAAAAASAVGQRGREPDAQPLGAQQGLAGSYLRGAA